MNTKSICPVCLKVLDAQYVPINNKIYMKKTCPTHGEFEVFIWDDINHFNSFNNINTTNEKVNSFLPTKKGCPYDCGICANHKQASCCVLLEVTKNCNLSCPICFANSTTKTKDYPIEEVYKWFDFLLENGGPFNIQLSGGEPTTRNDLHEIISYGKSKGFNFFQLNTNGIRIGEDYNYLKTLKSSGLNTVFLQFDGFLDETIKHFRGKNILENKLQAVENCRRAGITVVLVPTLQKGINDKEIATIIKFAIKNIDIIKTVHFQPISFFGRYHKTPENNDKMDLYYLLKEIQTQMNNEILIEDFSQGGAEHGLCSFNGDFLVGDDSSLTKLNLQKNSCYSSEQAMKSVAKKWTLQSNICDCTNTDSLDDFLIKMQNRRLSISAMGFQDVWNIDLNRLKKCYIHVFDNNRLIPFCSYNLTSVTGKSIYRNNSEEV